MPTTSALTEARATCEGLHRLIQKISEAAADIDKGGGSSYELLALITSATTCIINLETQLTIVESLDNPKVHPIKRDVTDTETDHFQPDEKITAAR